MPPEVNVKLALKGRPSTRHRTKAERVHADVQHALSGEFRLLRRSTVSLCTSNTPCYVLKGPLAATEGAGTVLIVNVERLLSQELPRHFSTSLLLHMILCCYPQPRHFVQVISKT